MKNINKKSVITIIILTLFTKGVFSQLKVRSDAAIQIGYEKYRYLSFGIEQNSPNNGKYAIEHWGDKERMSGLNFWKPWPTDNSGNYVLFLRDDKNVGINTIGDSKYRLDVAGYARSYFFYNMSDKRLKENVKTINTPLKTLLKLRGVTYTFNPIIENNKTPNLEGLEETKIKTMQESIPQKESHKSIGFIAQEVQEILPELVKEDDNGILSMNYDGIIPLLVESIKEQQITINELKDKISIIENNCCTSNFKKSEMGENLTINTSKLFSNSPNPFSNETKIEYFLILDENSKATISIYDLNGRLVNTYNLANENGNGVVTVLNETLKAGSYVYTLSINDEIIDSKIMIKIAH